MIVDTIIDYVSSGKGNEVKYGLGYNQKLVHTITDVNSLHFEK